MDSVEDVSGLARVQISINWDVSSKQLVRLSVQGKEDSCELELGQELVVEKWIVLCSHLLANGPNKLILEVFENSVLSESAALEFHVTNQSLLAKTVASSLVRNNVPLFLGEEVGSEMFDYEDESLKPWFDKEDALEQIKLMSVDEKTKGDLGAFVSDGYISLKNLLEPELVSKILDELELVVNEGYQGYVYGDSQRLHDLHAHYPGVNQLWTHPKIMEYVRVLFASGPRPCQTLTYIFGSQQDAHQDTVHLTPFPAGYMCGIWAALEDVREGSGELIVYKGSHKLPRIYLNTVGCGKVRGDESEFVSTVVAAWNDALRKHSFQTEVYQPSAGDVLIWHENLTHAGSKRANTNLSRKSIVSHVFADGCIAYYDSSGSVANMGRC
ncbi:MAG: hypothetical protein ACJAVI_004934 [Candidatus Azotimanducaceae bacterium]|jgi:hypothetical protein